MFQGKLRSTSIKNLAFGILGFWGAAASIVCNTALAAEAESDPSHFALTPSALYAIASAPHTREGTDVDVIESHRTYAFDADGKSVYTQYMVYKILSPAGAEGWNDVSIDWSPWLSQRPTMKARVILPDGKSFPLDPATIADTPANENDSTIFSDDRTLRAPLPAIAVGAVVETEIILKDTFPFPGSGKLGRAFFQMSQPVQHFRLTLQAPKSMNLRYRLDLLPNLKPVHTEQNAIDQWVFDSGPTDPYDELESGMPSDISAYPVVTFALGTTWQELAQAYSKVVNTQVDQSDLRSLVEKLIKGKETRDAKIKAIIEYLNKEIRYTGVEFDQASILPHSPIETLNRKFGDCKDKSTLLVAMLKAAGISANLALLNVGDQLDVSIELPGMGLFDHAIVYVPGTPGIWIDATDSNAQLGQLPDRDHGRMALIVDTNTTTLTQVTIAHSVDNKVLEEREVYLSDNGPARIVEISKPIGNFESDYRNVYADLTNKKTKENLTDYVKTHYQAESLDKLERTDPKDFSQPFMLTLETKRAKQGYTGLNEATAYIQLSDLFISLPSELKTREPTDEENAKATRAHKKRESDYELTRPYISEWHYKIIPPAGFEPATLPANVNLSIGPAKLSEEFSSDADGTVHALIQFDTVKKRYTIAEQSVLRAKIAELTNGPLIKIKFNLHAQTLFANGNADESFKAYRKLVELNPKSAVAHLRRADALLRAGMGEAARAEALVAVKLEPKSAFAQKTLAEILQYDLIGRWHKPGADFKGATAAYHTAINLDPNDKSLVGSYAILLEYDNLGIRYSEKADLRAAIAAYKMLTPQQLADIELPNNLAYTLFYARDFSGAKAQAESLSAPQINIITASDAQLNGVPSALEGARRRSNSDSNYKEIVSVAGKMLMNLREYNNAAALMEAGVSGTNTAATMGLITALKKSSKHETLHFEDKPDDFVLSFLVATMRSDFSFEKFQSFQSQNAISVSKTYTNEQQEDVLQNRRRIYASALHSGTPPEVLIDIALPSIQIKSSGDDTSGYREMVQTPGESKQAYFIIKENGKYKLLGTGKNPTAIALEVLDRVKNQNITGAQQLLNWLRDTTTIETGEDKFAGDLFPRFWPQARNDNDIKRITIAAASLLVQNRHFAERGLAILEQAKTESVSEADSENIELALMVGYLNTKNYDKSLASSKILEQRTSYSKRILYTQLECLNALQRFVDADKLVHERLAKNDEDIDALRSLSMNAVMRHDYTSAYEQAAKVTSTGNAEPSDFNQMGWISLFFNRPDGPDIESALRASQLRANSPSILHTLGCLYAETGKTKESRDVLLQFMDALNLEQPNSYAWYAFGRIAEQYGEHGIALADYKKVTPPTNLTSDPTATYLLAQHRMQILEGHQAKIK